MRSRQTDPRRTIRTDAIDTLDTGGTDFAGSLIYSVGCHSGLSVSEDITTALGDDWAQAFARGGAAAYFAQSGFGYGSSVGIELTEKLLVEFTQRLDGNFTTGEAAFLGKNEYLAGLKDISVYDEKALQQAILFGLPFSIPDVTDPPQRPGRSC